MNGILTQTTEITPTIEIIIFLAALCVGYTFGKYKGINLAIRRQEEFAVSQKETVLQPVTIQFNANINIDRQHKTISITLSNNYVLTREEIFKLLCGIADANNWAKDTSNASHPNSNTYSLQCF